jgi:hypothetical protein
MRSCVRSSCRRVAHAVGGAERQTRAEQEGRHEPTPAVPQPPCLEEIFYWRVLCLG